jgi:hypothetical protein
MSPSLSLTQSVIVSPSETDLSERLPFVACFASAETRVGNNPDSVARLGKANRRGWYTSPFRIVPARGQVPENFSEPSIKQPCDVLHDDKSRSKLANNSSVFSPEPRLLAGESDLWPVFGNILTGEPAADCIDGNSVCFQSLSGELANIFIDRDIGPMLFENSPAERFDLAERDSLEAARSFQAEAEPAYAGEQI